MLNFCQFYSFRYVSYDDYDSATYPGYCLGGGYLLSSDVVGEILKISYGRKIFPLEDLYVGLIIAEMLYVEVRDQRKHFDLFYMDRKYGCEINDIFVAHPVVGDDVRRQYIGSQDALKNC